MFISQILINFKGKLQNNILYIPKIWSLSREKASSGWMVGDEMLACLAKEPSLKCSGLNTWRNFKAHATNSSLYQVRPLPGEASWCQLTWESYYAFWKVPTFSCQRRRIWLLTRKQSGNHTKLVCLFTGSEIKWPKEKLHRLPEFLWCQLVLTA